LNDARCLHTTVILERVSLRGRSGIQHYNCRRLNIASATRFALDPQPSFALLTRLRMTEKIPEIAASVDTKAIARNVIPA
jgi:hypothetical protein